MRFDDERLEVYEVSREFNREVAAILKELPPGHWESADNLERAAKSIGRNLAEGAGRWLQADKIRFYQIARGSTTEGAASLDELVDWGLVQPERVLLAKQLAWRIVAMLIGMIRALEQMPQRQNGPRRKTATKSLPTPTPARAPVRQLPQAKHEQR